MASLVVRGRSAERRHPVSGKCDSSDAARREFEEWYLLGSPRASGSWVDKKSCGDAYKDPVAQARWAAWKAARTRPDELLAFAQNIIHRAGIADVHQRNAILHTPGTIKKLHEIAAYLNPEGE